MTSRGSSPGRERRSSASRPMEAGDAGRVAGAGRAGAHRMRGARDPSRGRPHPLRRRGRGAGACGRVGPSSTIAGAIGGWPTARSDGALRVPRALQHGVVLPRPQRRGGPRRQGAACYWRDEAYTYREVQARANRFGHALRAPGRRRRGPRAASSCPTGPSSRSPGSGRPRSGAVIAMVNPLLPAEDYVHYFEYTRAKVAVVDDSTLDRLEPLRDRFRTCATWSWSASPGRHVSLRGGLRASRRPARRTRTRTATTPPSGSSPAARPASPRRPSTCSRTCPGTPSATRSR